MKKPLCTLVILGLLSLSFFSGGQNRLASGLKAVLIVGPQEDQTPLAKQSMNRIAKLLESNGVVAYRFYDDEADWNKIRSVSSECSFFIYSGHGSTLGPNGNVGGLCIKTMISTKELISELKLKDNALVLFQSVCYGAGSTAGDDEDIGIDEAKNRVSHYASPFFQIGASAYYANNFQDGVYNFLNDFLAGEPLKKAYQKSAEEWTTIEFDEPFSSDSKKFSSIASTPGGGTAIRTTYINGVKKVEEVKSPKSYEIACIGNPEFSIRFMKQR